MKASHDSAANQRGKRIVLMLLMLLAATVSAQAQSALTQAAHDEIDHWLRGGDLRMVAWGAYFATKNGDRGEIPVIASLVENYHANGQRQFDGKGNYIPWSTAQQENYDSMQEVLDSLIQLHGKATYQAVLAVAPDFPDQAMTLLATMQKSARTQAAIAVYATRDRTEKPYEWHDFNHQQMVHVAAAILAHDPPPGFTATLLNEATVHLNIVVADDSEQRYFAKSVTCGDAPGLQPLPGWPQPYTYVVEETWKSRHPLNALVNSEPAITFFRNIASGTCSRLPGFTSVERLRLAEEEAGPGFKNLYFNQPMTLQYPGATNYLAALSGLIDQYEKRFRAAANKLAAKSYLTPDEATTAMPTFSIEISDQRKDQTMPLPIPTTLGPRVVVIPSDSPALKAN